MILLDATMLLLFLSPDAALPNDPTTGSPVEYAKERVEALVKTLEKRRTRIIVPAPALSEVLVHAGRALENYVKRLENSAVFQIAAFDVRAAVEVALMTKDAMNGGNKRSPGTGVWAKIKYDRQIVAIAKVRGVEAIYSDDVNIKAFAAKFEIPVVTLAECPVPQESLQGRLKLESNRVSAKLPPEAKQSQIDRFREAARSLGCDEDGATFDEKLKGIARQKIKTGSHTTWRR